MIESPKMMNCSGILRSMVDGVRATEWSEGRICMSSINGHGPILTRCCEGEVLT